MAIARLTRVTVEAPPEQLGAMLARLLAFGRFHPSRREGLVQDIRLLLLGSRAQAIYERANTLLQAEPFREIRPRRPERRRYAVPDLEGLLREREEDLETVARAVGMVRSEADRHELAEELRTIRQVGLSVLHGVHRLLVVPSDSGALRIEGYVPSRELARFQAMVGPWLRSAVPVLQRGQEDAYVPTLLLNPRIISVFEELTVQRGIPRYSELDPTPIVALVFPFFFGLMFGDLGHGLTLLAVGAYLIVRTRYAYWGRLIVVFGAAASLIGILRGVFFGITFPTPVGWVVALPPALSAELTFSYVPLLIQMAVLVGTFHLASAYAMALVNQLRSRRYLPAAVRGVPTLVLYSSLVPFGFAILGARFRPWDVFSSTASTPFFLEFLGVRIPVSQVAWVSAPLVVASLLTLVIGPVLERWALSRSTRGALGGLRTGASDALARPVEFTLNTLSYIRLAALLIANTLLTGLVAGVVAYGLAGVVLAALLNLAMMAMEGVIVYLQDMRLHWMEWLSKFYAGTGTAFDPLALRGDRFQVDWS